VQPFKRQKIVYVPRDQHEVMDESDGRDLAIGERRSSAISGEPSPLARMAFRSSYVIGKNDQGGSKGLPQVFLDRRAALRRRKPMAAVEKLMPDRSGRYQIRPVLLDLLQNGGIGNGLQRLR
jgi:hypothetical protein